MCASYGLDPRFGDYPSIARAGDRELMESLRAWAEKNAGETLRPTGKNLRNLNPIITDSGSEPELVRAWWGYLVGGEPARFPSINTRAERLQQRPGGLATRALVPATSWLEMQKPSRDWYRFALSGPELFTMAAVTRRGVPTGGKPVSCYSIVMQPAPQDLLNIHDRMPLLIPADFAEEWLSTDAKPTRGLIDAALSAGRELADQISAELAT